MPTQAKQTCGPQVPTGVALVYHDEEWVEMSLAFMANGPARTSSQCVHSGTWLVNDTRHKLHCSSFMHNG